MKGIIILNPNAHSGEAPLKRNELQEQITEQMKTALHLESITWCETEHPGHGTALAADAVRQGYEYIFAGGGDGTINEVLNGIMQAVPTPTSRPVMGVLPFGTSNDFFAALKTAESTRKAKQHDRLTLDLDVGHVDFDSAQRYFCLTAGMGLFSWANEQYLEASHTFGRRFAHIPAAISTILSYRFQPKVKISLNGKRTRNRRLWSVVINNSPVIAGGTLLTPEARLDDGYLDVCMVKPVSLLRLAWLVFLMTRNAHTHSRSVALGRIHDIVVVAKEPLPIHVDGELVPEINSKARRMSVRILPHALRIVLPSLCEIAPKAAASVEQPVAT
jgi:YegS/Rv2252/BmrU family lipid kinase